MKAEDTVIGLEMVSPKFPDYIPCAVWGVLEKQAKITWPIAEQAGRREVVEWMGHSFVSTFESGEGIVLSIPKVEWQAKLKEWRVE